MPVSCPSELVVVIGMPYSVASLPVGAEETEVYDHERAKRCLTGIDDSRRESLGAWTEALPAMRRLAPPAPLMDDLPDSVPVHPHRSVLARLAIKLHEIDVHHPSTHLDDGARHVTELRQIPNGRVEVDTIAHLKGGSVPHRRLRF